MAKYIVSVIVGWILLTCNAPQGFTQDTTDLDLADFSLEELMDIEVVSISRKAESIQGAAAAIFVISAEDIRRSGVHSIPEALRLAPGINVARINSSSWAITSRGFNSRFANKLQVLVDGRSVYSPMFSGVYWEESSVMIEDIERIEIIRGPGATMWGANAVNGVINIITAKPEVDKSDSFVSVLADSKEDYRSAGRLDGTVGTGGAWRLSAQAKKHGSSITETGEDSFDAWDEQLVRLRYQQKLGENDHLSISSHFFHGDIEHQYHNNTPTPPYSEVMQGTVNFVTASLQSSWERTISQTAGLKMAFYFTHFERNENILQDTHHFMEFDFQINFNASKNHSAIWGASWKHYQDDMQGNPSISFIPDSISGQIFSAFAQDDWSIISDRLNLILGSKWEYRKITGHQWQPNARLAWTPSENATWWGSMSRAIRTPSRINLHVQMDMLMLPPMGPGSLPTSLSMIGNPNMKLEELVAYETGFRFKPAKNLSLDLALFINDYDNLRILTMGAPSPHPVYGPSVLMMPLVVGNGAGGHTMGGELATNWKASKQFQCQLAYSYWDYKPDDTSADGLDSGMERLATPKHQISLRGILNPVTNWEADVWFRFTDDLMSDSNDVKAWSELDLRLSWAPIPRLKLIWGGQNLLNDNHLEFIYASSAPSPGFIQRSAYVEMRWSF